MANGKAFEGVINAPALTCSISSAAQPCLPLFSSLFLFSSSFSFLFVLKEI